VIDARYDNQRVSSWRIENSQFVDFVETFYNQYDDRAYKTEVKNHEISPQVRLHSEVTEHTDFGDVLVHQYEEEEEEARRKQPKDVCKTLKRGGDKDDS